MSCKRIMLILVFEPICTFYEIPAAAQREVGYSTLPAVETILGTCIFRIMWVFTVLRYSGIKAPWKAVHRVPDNLGGHLRGGGNKLRRDLEKDISQQTAHSELTLVCKTPGRSRFRPGVILFMPGLVTLFPAAFRRAPRAVTSAGTTPLPPCAPHCCDKSGGDRQYK